MESEQSIIKKKTKKAVKNRRGKRQAGVQVANLVATNVKLKEVAEEAKPLDDLNASGVSFWTRLLRRNKKQIAYIIGGVLALLLGFWLASLWGSQRDNLILTLGVIILIPGGAFLIYRGLQRSDHEAVIVGAEKPTEKVNSLNIYAAEDNATGKPYAVKVAFEWVDNPEGQPQQCLNNSKWYYVHIWEIKGDILKPFVLPDSQYFDPREFANVITMPAHKKLFEKKVSMLQKVAPWVMIVAFLIAIFGMITTAPTGG